MQLRSGPPRPGGDRHPERHCGDARSTRFSYKPVASQPRLRCGADPDGIRQGRGVDREARSGRISTPAPASWSRRRPAELVALADLLTLPCATTLNGKSAFPEDHPLSLGIGGFVKARYNTLPAAQIAGNADVVLAVGCGFKYEATLKKPDNGVKLIQVDIEPSEINRAQLADIALMGDARIALAQMLDYAKATLPASRLKRDRRSHRRDRTTQNALGRGMRAVARVRGGADQSFPRHQGAAARSCSRRTPSFCTTPARCAAPSRTITPPRIHARSSASACRAPWAGRSAPRSAPRRRIPTSSLSPSSARRPCTRPRSTSRPRFATTRRCSCW